MSKNKYILPFKGEWYVEHGGYNKKNPTLGTSFLNDMHMILKLGKIIYHITMTIKF